MAAVEIVRLTDSRISSFRDCVDQVARGGGDLRIQTAPALEDVQRWLKGSETRCVTAFVALAEGQVIGWADIVSPARLSLQAKGKLGMGMLLEWRRQGIGRQLLSHVIDAAIELNLDRIVLEVFTSNQAAIALYESSNFKTIKREHERIQMERKLN